MTTTPAPTTDSPEQLLGKGIVTARTYGWHGPDWLADKLAGLDWDRDRYAQVLARALIALAEDGRIGPHVNLRDEIAEVLFDDAHEGCGCDDKPCTGGGLPAWIEYTEMIMPVIERYAIPAPSLADPNGAGL